MGILVVSLIFILDVVVVWQLLRSPLSFSRLFFYLAIVLLIPVIGVTIYYVSELLIPKKKSRQFKT